MAIYKIADVCVEMSPVGKTLIQAEKYLTTTENLPHIKIDVSNEDMKRLAKRLPHAFEDELWYLLSGASFYAKLLDFDGFLLHSSAVCVNNNAYLFSGQSGIGKSTHTSLWKQLFGDDCFVLNDDKPAVRFVDGGVYAYGTPWSGKHDISINTRVPVKAICFINRGKENKITRLPDSLAAFNLISQGSSILSETQCDKMLELIERLIEKVPVYKLECTPDIGAAKLSYQTMSGDTL